MAYDNNGGMSSGRTLVDVSHMNLKCASCGTAINELPFEPKNDRPVYCRECNRANRNARTGGSAPVREKRLYDVSSMNLSCANCGTAITELPFQPSQDRPVYCKDCVRQRRAE